MAAAKRTPPAPFVPKPHFVPYDTERYNRGRMGKAECGRIVDLTAHSIDPNCEECAAIRVDKDRSSTEAIG